MSQEVAPGATPPVPGQKEEPELANEKDIPEDDAGPRDDEVPLPEGGQAPGERPLRDVERE